MKATELRIGNIVEEFRYKVNACKVIEILLGDEIRVIPKGESESVVIELQFIQPIPLTPEILEKAGFERIQNEWHNNWRVKVAQDETSDSFHSVTNEGNLWHYNNDESDAGCYFVKSIKYLHELQNLCFTLSDKELEIKL